MGIDPADQRRRMNEALDAIMPLITGEVVSRKTDWFEMRECQMQLPCYTRPHIEMAVACARSPSGALAAGKHGLGNALNRGHVGRSSATSRQQFGACVNRPRPSTARP